MQPHFVPIPTAEAWQMSNPAILPLAALRASLQIFSEAGGMQPLRARSLELTGRLERQLKTIGSGKLQIFTPSDPQQRGCQLSIRVLGGSGKSVFDALTDGGKFIADWREPDCIRVAPTPLYNTEADVDALAKRLAALL
jgi:kynureninase